MKPDAAPKRTLLHRLKSLGPGLITAASDDDPSGIATHSVAGATAGLSMLWLVLFTTPMMAVIQGMCARIAMVTGRGLGANIRSAIPVPLAYVIAAAVIVANTFNVGADFAGMAASAHMIAPIVSTFLWVAIFGLSLFVMVIFLSYRRIVAVIKWMTISLFAYVITAFWVHPAWGLVLRNLVTPQIHAQRAWIMTAMAVVGTTISPYLFFWQSSLEVEEEKSLGRATIKQRRGATKAEIVDAHFDVNSGMIFANLIVAFVIVTTALTLFAHGKTHIATAQDAAAALAPLAGHFASLIFTVGIVGTGLLAIPALAGSSAYVAAEIFRFRGGGMDARPSRAPRFYAVFGTGLLVGVIMCFAGVDPIRGLYYAAILNGLVSIPLVFLIVRIASNAKVMGKWRSSVWARAWGWLTFLLMGTTAVSLFALR